MMLLHAVFLCTYLLDRRRSVFGLLFMYCTDGRTRTVGHRYNNIIIQYSNITIRTGRTVTSPADEDGRLVDKSKRNKQSRNVWMDGWCVVLSSEFWGISFSFLSLFRSSEPMYVFGLGLIHYNTTMAS